MVMAWLVNSLEPKIGRTYLFYKSKQIWDMVKEMYSDLENSSQFFEIKSELKDMKQGDYFVIEYYNNLTSL